MKRKPFKPLLTMAVDLHFEVEIPIEDKEYWDNASEAERHQYLWDRIDCQFCDAGVAHVGTSVEGDRVEAVEP